jgi:hypothetical protein
MRTFLLCLAAATVALANVGVSASPADADAGVVALRCPAAKAPGKRATRCATSKRPCAQARKRRSACARSGKATVSTRRRSTAKRRQSVRPTRPAAPVTPATPVTRPAPPAPTAPAEPVPVAKALTPAPAPAPAGSGGSAGPGSGTAVRLFAPDSVWNAPLSDSAPLDPTSGARMAELSAEVRAEVASGIGPWITESSYSTPLYTVPAGQPRVRVTLDTGSWGAKLQQVLDHGVPIPAGASPAKGTDGHLTVYQPSSDTLWEFWRAVKKADGWHASWGGAMQRVSQSPGYYTNAAWPTLAPWEGWNWGSTATSLPMIAGTIMIHELQRGRIDHALAVDIPDACAKTFSWPAQRTDGGLTTPDCLPQGAHLRLDPALDLSKLSLPRITRILAEAAQRYGMIVRDKTYRAVGLYAEDPTPTGTEPYWGPDGLYGGLAPWKFLPRFPWDRLQLLRMTVCSQAPCVRSAASASGGTVRAASAGSRANPRRDGPRRGSAAMRRRTTPGTH